MAVNQESLLKKYISRDQEKQTGQAPRRGPGGGPGGRNRGMNATGKPKAAKASVKRLFSYIGNDKYKLIIVLICLLASTVSSLGGSYLLRPIVNKLVAPDTSVQKKLSELLSGILLMVAIYVVGVLASYGQSRFMLKISQNALQRIREDLFNKLQRLPVSYFDTNSHGELMSRFTNDVDVIGEMMNTTIVQVFSGVISLIGTLALMLYTNVILALVVIVSVPLFAKAGGAIANRSRKLYKSQQAALGGVNGYIEETVTGQKVVKVFNHEDISIEEFQVLSDHLQKSQMNAQFFGGIMGPVMGNMSQISYAITAMIGGILCVLGKFDIGGLTIFTNYSRQFSRPINEISMQMNVIFSALAGAERVFDVMDQEPEAADGENAVKDGVMDGQVTLSDVTFSYVPGKVILNHISCYAKPGQKIAFVGSTGAGKTTITNLINRFYDIDSGQILIGGRDIRDYSRSYLRQNVAMVLQDTHLFTGTVMENIRYGRMDATDEEVKEAAKLASAHTFIKRLKYGYDTMLEGAGANLSQGQRQLINIARAAVSKAPILILDEATSSVDTRTERHIERGMDRLMKERTTFVIAHRLSTVRNANCIMVLEHGEIIERGTHEELLAMKGRYYNLYTGKAELD